MKDGEGPVAYWVAWCDYCAAFAGEDVAGAHVFS